MQTLEIGLAGFGTVGGGTYRVLTENADCIEQRIGKRFHVKTVVCRNTARLTGVIASDTQASTSLDAIIRDPDIAIVVEVIGGIEPAKGFIESALRAGKHVVTANKHLLAKHGAELFALAERQGVTLAYEASVAGGIPIIKALREGLVANRVRSIAGIVNGTSNFILTTMREKREAFENVLKEAQRLGYAEADPTFDVEGIDAAHKMTLLAALAFGTAPRFDAAFVEGISCIDAKDHVLAEHLGYRVKLLGTTRKTEQGIELGVHPSLVSATGSFSAVNGVFNGVLVEADGLGTTFYSGRGAGALPTASAVVADICDIARSTEHPFGLGVPKDVWKDTTYLPAEKTCSEFYVRVPKTQLEPVLQSMKRASIAVADSIADETDAAFLTEETTYGSVREALRAALGSGSFRILFKSRF